jgi:hypothetical protein
MRSQADFKRIPVQDLLLDATNPRLPKSMANKSEKDIINFFLSDASLVELMLAIGKNDFFEGEQLLVIKSSEDKYTVIEGNRRLSAVKLLHEPSLAIHYKSKVEQVIEQSVFFPDSIPCLVFDEKDQILKYLGFRHITGIKSWKLLEKARYVTSLKNDFYSVMSLPSASREIAKMIGSRQDYVLRILTGYHLYDIIERNNFYNLKGLDDTTFHFNYIADSLSRSNIAAFLGIDFDLDNPVQNIKTDNLKEWTKWLFDKDLPNKIIGDSNNLNLLNKILDPHHEKAIQVFRDGTPIRVAVEFTDDIKEQFENAVQSAINNLEKADSLSHKQTEFDERLDEDLRSISSIIRKIKSVKDDLEAKDDLGL